MDGSAKGLQRLLGIGGYQTAWAWLHRLSRGMVRSGQAPLDGTVEVAMFCIGDEELGIRGQQTLKKVKGAVAMEIRGTSRHRTVCVWLRHVRDFSRRSLVPFVVESVAPGTRVITDGWKCPASVENGHPQSPARELLSCEHRLGLAS